MIVLFYSSKVNTFFSSIFPAFLLIVICFKDGQWPFHFYALCISIFNLALPWTKCVTLLVTLEFKAKRNHILVQVLPRFQNMMLGFFHMKIFFWINMTYLYVVLIFCTYLLQIWNPIVVTQTFEVAVHKGMLSNLISQLYRLMNQYYLKIVVFHRYIVDWITTTFVYMAANRFLN